ncbi:MAG: PUA domain-containing protein [Candidatus Hodarchaeales archaeon]|jgi:predicted RNA-binding protein (TIGR00451 family)
MAIRKELGSKEKKTILDSINAPGLSPSSLKKQIQFIFHDEVSNKKYLYNKNQEMTFFFYESFFLPTLMFIRSFPEIQFPIIQVDEGAVKFIISGADIFTQGIVNIDQEFKENSILLILNPQKSVLCIGKSLLNSKLMKETAGKGILNIHYLGDRIWEGKI